MVWCGCYDELEMKEFLEELLLVGWDMFDRIQVVSLKWLLSNKATLPYLFYEKRIEPFDCIVR
jgi:hypothetical protein